MFTFIAEDLQPWTRMRHKDGKIHREGSKKHAENVVANSTRATSVSNIRQVDRYKYTFCVAVHNYWCCCCWRLLAVHRSSSNVRQKSMERSIPFKMLYGTNLIMEWLNLLYDASMLSGPKLMLNEKNDCSIAFFQICEKKIGRQCEQAFIWEDSNFIIHMHQVNG